MKEFKNWKPPVLPEQIPQGDMPGDKVVISEYHIDRANRIFPDLLEEIEKLKKENGSQKIVVAVCGGSGVGKSGIAAVLSYYLKEIGLGSYTLSGDNYPHRIPEYNDAERLHLFREGALKEMLKDGEYTKERFDIIHALQVEGEDANLENIKKYPWYESYINGGHKALEGYLGTENELAFKELEDILNKFKSGADKIWLKRMGRTNTELWYDEIDFKDVGVLMIEWTHGNSDYYKGVDIPILLHSTPQETLEYRLLRNRDGEIDSPFTTMVLEIEQEMLKNQAHKAKIIIAKNGERLTYPEYCKSMGM
ncbi:adenylylsulfate kinase [Lachnoanaerobaculum gingivalis]|uniref:Adenylylsulfate kinase n=1 Tax=Lachnoanaerobaculum gingivalis TaxID=2490855 RepID=A0A3P3R0C7_9FIRM|nr:adenylylsulfate kinase [Lachnoanaerobaculum gingivalis]RRJ26922.1 adenylylsulfate kinase [Lachnoanaerobaculum gingivalis]